MLKSSVNQQWFMNVYMGKKFRILIKLTLLLDCFYYQLCQNLYTINFFWKMLLNSLEKWHWLLNVSMLIYLTIFINHYCLLNDSVGTYFKIFMKLALIFECLHWKLYQKIHEITIDFVDIFGEIMLYTLTLEQAH